MERNFQRPSDWSSRVLWILKTALSSYCAPKFLEVFWGPFIFLNLLLSVLKSKRSFAFKTEKPWRHFWHLAFCFLRLRKKIPFARSLLVSQFVLKRRKPFFTSNSSKFQQKHQRQAAVFFSWKEITKTWGLQCQSVWRVKRRESSTYVTLKGLKSEIKWWRLGANPMQDCCGRLESSKKWKKLVSFICCVARFYKAVSVTRFRRIGPRHKINCHIGCFPYSLVRKAR
jgi:hypothetical protein